MNGWLELAIPLLLLFGLLVYRLSSFRAFARLGNEDGRTIAEGTVTSLVLAASSPEDQRSTFIPMPKVLVTLVTFDDGRRVKLLGDQTRRCRPGQHVRVRRRMLGGYDFEVITAP